MRRVRLRRTAKSSAEAEAKPVLLALYLCVPMHFDPLWYLANEAIRLYLDHETSALARLNAASSLRTNF